MSDFRVGNYGLAKRPDGRSPYWQRCWYDNKTRQQRYASLGTTDVQVAEERLTLWFIENQKVTEQKPAETLIEDVLLRYYEQHAKHLASAEAANYACGYWSTFFAGETISSLTIARQEAFVGWLREKGHSDGYISRTLAVGRAALKRANKRQELVAVPFIMDCETDFDRRHKEPKGRPITVDEFVALYNEAMARHIQLYLIVAATTLARPEAIYDLHTDQIDWTDRLISLNPPGRKQTKKRRATVPLTNTLATFLTDVPSGLIVNHHGKKICTIKATWRRMRDRAGLDDRVNRYSIRHMMARELRRRGIPQHEIGMYLGHVETGITAVYAPSDPSYLRRAATAIDDFFTPVLPRLRPLHRFAYHSLSTVGDED